MLINVYQCTHYFLLAGEGHFNSVDTHWLQLHGGGGDGRNHFILYIVHRLSIHLSLVPLLAQSLRNKYRCSDISIYLYTYYSHNSINCMLCTLWAFYMFWWFDIGVIDAASQPDIHPTPTVTPAVATAGFPGLG